MNKKLKAYFAHPWISRTHGAAIIVQRLLEQALPEIEFINPFLAGDLTEQWLAKPNDLTVAKAIVRKDLQLMQECDVIISYFPDMAGIIPLTGGIGTPMEYFYMRHVLYKPVYALTPFKHPWLMALDVRCEQDIYVLIKRIRTELKL